MDPQQQQQQPQRIITADNFNMNDFDFEGHPLLDINNPANAERRKEFEINFRNLLRKNDKRLTHTEEERAHQQALAEKVHEIRIREANKKFNDYITSPKFLKKFPDNKVDPQEIANDLNNNEFLQHGNIATKENNFMGVKQIDSDTVKTLMDINRRPGDKIENLNQAIQNGELKNLVNIEGNAKHQLGDIVKNLAPVLNKINAAAPSPEGGVSRRDLEIERLRKEKDQELEKIKPTLGWDRQMSPKYERKYMSFDGKEQSSINNMLMSHAMHGELKDLSGTPVLDGLNGAGSYEHDLNKSLGRLYNFDTKNIFHDGTILNPNEEWKKLHTKLVKGKKDYLAKRFPESAKTSDENKELMTINKEFPAAKIEDHIGAAGATKTANAAQDLLMGKDKDEPKKSKMSLKLKAALLGGGTLVGATAINDISKHLSENSLIIENVLDDSMFSDMQLLPEYPDALKSVIPEEEFNSLSGEEKQGILDDYLPGAVLTVGGIALHTGGAHVAQNIIAKKQMNPNKGEKIMSNIFDHMDGKQGAFSQLKDGLGGAVAPEMGIIKDHLKKAILKNDLNEGELKVLKNMLQGNFSEAAVDPNFIHNKKIQDIARNMNVPVDTILKHVNEHEKQVRANLTDQALADIARTKLGSYEKIYKDSDLGKFGTGIGNSLNDENIKKIVNMNDTQRANLGKLGAFEKGGRIAGTAGLAYLDPAAGALTATKYVADMNFKNERMKAAQSLLNSTVADPIEMNMAKSKVMKDINDDEVKADSKGTSLVTKYLMNPVAGDIQELAGKMGNQFKQDTAAFGKANKQGFDKSLLHGEQKGYINFDNNIHPDVDKNSPEFKEKKNEFLNGIKQSAKSMQDVYNTNVKGSQEKVDQLAKKQKLKFKNNLNTLLTGKPAAASLHESSNLLQEFNLVAQDLGKDEEESKKNLATKLKNVTDNNESNIELRKKSMEKLRDLKFDERSRLGKVMAAPQIFHHGSNIAKSYGINIPKLYGGMALGVYSIGHGGNKMLDYANEKLGGVPEIDTYTDVGKAAGIELGNIAKSGAEDLLESALLVLENINDLKEQQKIDEKQEQELSPAEIKKREKLAKEIKAHGYKSSQYKLEGARNLNSGKIYRGLFKNAQGLYHDKMAIAKTKNGSLRGSLSVNAPLALTGVSGIVGIGDLAHSTYNYIKPSPDAGDWASHPIDSFDQVNHDIPFMLKGMSMPISESELIQEERKQWIKDNIARKKEIKTLKQNLKDADHELGDHYENKFGDSIGNLLSDRLAGKPSDEAAKKASEVAKESEPIVKKGADSAARLYKLRNARLNEIKLMKDVQRKKGNLLGINGDEGLKAKVGIGTAGGALAGGLLTDNIQDRLNRLDITSQDDDDMDTNTLIGTGVGALLGGGLGFRNFKQNNSEASRKQLEALRKQHKDENIVTGVNPDKVFKDVMTDKEKAKYLFTDANGNRDLHPDNIMRNLQFLDNSSYKGNVPFKKLLDYNKRDVLNRNYSYFNLFRNDEQETPEQKRMKKMEELMDDLKNPRKSKIEY